MHKRPADVIVDTHTGPAGGGSGSAPLKTIKVAVKTPLYRVFDYLPPAPAAEPLTPGCRVRVPFGRRRVTGVIWATDATSDIDVAKLKRIERVLDTEPVLPDDALELLRFAAGYYQHAPGEVVAAALPKALRDGAPSVADGGCLAPDRTTRTTNAAAIAAARSAAKRSVSEAYGVRRVASQRAG